MGYHGRVVLVIIATLNLLAYCIFTTQIKLLHLGYFSGGFIVAWVLGHMFDEMKHHAERDALTGVRNRRNAKKIFERLLKRANMQSYHLAVFIVDVDDFKAINDQHDHRTGDIVLQLLTHKLVELFGTYNHIIRWGGDEFIVLHMFRDSEEIEAMHAVLQEEVKTLSAKMPFDFSVSIGYSLHPRDGDQFDQLIHIADQNMYANKSARSTQSLNISR